MLKKIQNAYYALFYYIYRLNERNPMAFWSDMKTMITMDVLVLFKVLSFIVYYKTFFNRSFNISNHYELTLLLLFLIVFVPNYFIFQYRNRWMQIVDEFDKLPKKTKRWQSWLSFGVVLLVIANLIFAFYQMSLVDWSKYR